MAGKRPDFVGVYITSSRIEAACFEGDDNPQLVAQGHIEVPEGAFDSDGDIADPSMLADLLKELWGQAGFKAWKAVVVLSSRKAIVRQIKLPHMPEHSLQQTILSEAEQFALFRKEEPLVHFFISDPEGEFMSICFGAISSEVVKQYNEVCKLAGIKLLSIDLVQLAGQRGMAYWYPPEQDYWTGVMVLSQRLIVSYWKDARLQNIREILLPDRERISMEALAQNYIADVTRTLSDDAEYFEDPHLVIGCEDLNDARDLAVAIQSYFNFPAQIAGTGEFGTEPAGALPGVDGEPNTPITVSYITIGAARWGDPGVVASFNLTKFASRSAISGPFRLEHVQQIFRNIPVMPVLGLVSALVVSMGGLWLWKTILDHQIFDLKTKVAHIQGDTTTFESIAGKLKPQEVILHDWLKDQGEHEFAEAFVGKLRDLIPADTWIASIEYTEGKNMVIEGASLHQNSPLKFATELGNLSAVTDPRVRNLTQSGSFFQFDLYATLVHQDIALPKVSAL